MLIWKQWLLGDVTRKFTIFHFLYGIIIWDVSATSSWNLYEILRYLFQVLATLLRRDALRRGCITASGNILTSENISLKLFMAPFETIELLTLWYVMAEHDFAQL